MRTTTPRSRRGAPRVLLAEDEPFLRDLLDRCLGAMDYEVAAAADGAEAWERFRAAAFDVVVTDQFMPRMTGLELTACIREADPRIPVILITGFTDLLPADAVRSAGIHSCLMKPFRPAELCSAIRRALDGEAASPAT